MGLVDLSEMWALQLEAGFHQPGDVPTGPDPHPRRHAQARWGGLIGRSHPSRRRLQLWESWPGFQGRGLGREGQRPSLQPRCVSVHLLRGTFENTGGKQAQSRETEACSWAVGWGGEDKGGRNMSGVTSDGGRGQGHSTVVTGRQGKEAIGNFPEKAMGELEPSARKEPAKGRAGEG